MLCVVMSFEVPFSVSALVGVFFLVGGREGYVGIQRAVIGDTRTVSRVRLERYRIHWDTRVLSLVRFVSHTRVFTRVHPAGVKPGQAESCLGISPSTSKVDTFRNIPLKGSGGRVGPRAVVGGFRRRKRFSCT